MLLNISPRGVNVNKIKLFLTGLIVLLSIQCGGGGSVSSGNGGQDESGNTLEDLSSESAGEQQNIESLSQEISAIIEDYQNNAVIYYSDYEEGDDFELAVADFQPDGIVHLCNYYYDDIQGTYSIIYETRKLCFNGEYQIEQTEQGVNIILGRTVMLGNTYFYYYKLARGSTTSPLEIESMTIGGSYINTEIVLTLPVNEYQNNQFSDLTAFFERSFSDHSLNNYHFEVVEDYPQNWSEEIKSLTDTD